MRLFAAAEVSSRVRETAIFEGMIGPESLWIWAGVLAAWIYWWRETRKNRRYYGDIHSSFGRRS